MVKNNIMVQIMWHSTDILNLPPLKTLLCFEKRALHLILLIAAEQPGPLAFWGCHFVPQRPFSSMLSSDCNRVFSRELFAPLPGVNTDVSLIML